MLHREIELTAKLEFIYQRSQLCFEIQTKPCYLQQQGQVHFTSNHQWRVKMEDSLFDCKGQWDLQVFTSTLLLFELIIVSKIC